MLDTFDSGPIHMDVDTETGTLHVRYFTIGYYTHDRVRELAEFFGKHYADKAAKPAEPKKAK